MIGFEYLHKELLNRKSEDYDHYKNFSEGDLAIELVNLKFFNVSDIDWTIFYSLSLIIERTENPRSEICKGIQIESFVKEFYGLDRKYLLEQFRDNARQYIPQCYQSAVLSDFENESSRLLCEGNKSGSCEDGDTFDILRGILEKFRDSNGLSRLEWFCINSALNKLEGNRLKYEMMKSENLSYRKRIEELEAQSQSHGITIDKICNYAKEHLDRKDRQVVSLMLLHIVDDSDVETRAKIKELDKKTPLDAQKVVLGDEVQTKIVKP